MDITYSWATSWEGLRSKGLAESEAAGALERRMAESLFAQNGAMAVAHREGAVAGVGIFAWKRDGDRIGCDLRVAFVAEAHRGAGVRAQLHVMLIGMARGNPHPSFCDVHMADGVRRFDLRASGA